MQVMSLWMLYFLIKKFDMIRTICATVWCYDENSINDIKYVILSDWTEIILTMIEMLTNNNRKSYRHYKRYEQPWDSISQP